MLPEDPILLPEIRDQIVLVAGHPASERENEELERKAAWPEITWETRPALTGPRPIKRTLRGRPCTVVSLHRRCRPRSRAAFRWSPDQQAAMRGGDVGSSPDCVDRSAAR